MTATHFSALANVFVSVLVTRSSGEMVKNWQAYLGTPVNSGSYKLVFEWDHDASEAVVVGHAPGLKPTDDPRCSGGSPLNAFDGQPYWMPRFFPRPVSAEITRQTGIEFISADWQPCGHKDITICHGESHYDIHLYYVGEQTLNSWPACDIGTSRNPNLPVCEDTANPINGAYYQTINKNMPVSATISADRTASTTTHKDFNFCLDPSSAILRSGVHYGDKSETLDEWKTPVSIVGSHDCQLIFFEPMVSWKWMAGVIPNTAWPYFKVENITYNNKQFEALPNSWSINVSESCGYQNGPCHVQLTVEGTKCPEGGCNRQRECGDVISCNTGQTYVNNATAEQQNGKAPASFSVKNVGFPSALSIALASIAVAG
jgi:hypothetical protein